MGECELTITDRISWFRSEILPRLGLKNAHINMLVEWGFFTAPASRKYRGTHAGALFDHSKSVMELLLEWTEAGFFKWQRERSPYVVGMLHDLCKSDAYTAIYDEGDSKTVKEYVHNEELLLAGHGAKSVLMASQLLTLTEEEVLCIRYHMGAYETEEWRLFDAAMRKYDTVLWTHHADNYSAKIKLT